MFSFHLSRFEVTCLLSQAVFRLAFVSRVFVRLSLALTSILSKHVSTSRGVGGPLFGFFPLCERISRFYRTVVYLRLDNNVVK